MSIVKKHRSCLKERLPRLTIKGLIVYCTNNIAGIPEKKFDWADALVDAAIISDVTFFSTLGGGWWQE